MARLGKLPLARALGSILAVPAATYSTYITATLVSFATRVKRSTASREVEYQVANVSPKLLLNVLHPWSLRLHGDVVGPSVMFYSGFVIDSRTLYII